MQFDISFLRNAISGISILNSTLPTFPSVSIDSRTATPEDIFFALSGQQSDGHTFLADALKKNVAGIVLAQEKQDVLKELDQSLLKDKFVALVPDTCEALIALATAWRNQFTGKVIGITGSIGKTTTNELIAQILKESNEPVFVATGTQNTFIGIALNLLLLRPEHTVGLFELGINKRGQMAKKAAMVKPTSAVITSIGHSHMEGLGSIHDIAAEKRDIFALFKEDNIGIINGDFTLLASVSYNYPMIKFGSKTTNQIQARKIKVDSSTITFALKIYKERFTVTLPSNHAGYLSNCLAAIATAYYLGVPTATIVSAIQKPLRVPGRFEWCQLKNGNGVIINDAYNASPESMKAALVAFQHLPAKGAKIAVLGDMLELGVNSPFWHRQLGRLLRKAPSLQEVILVGSLVEWTKKTVPLNVKVEHVATWQDALELVQQKVKQDSALLIKGSHAMGLSHLVEKLV